MFDSIMRKLKSSRVFAINRFCKNLASHMAKIRMMPIHKVPVLMLHKLSFDEPTEKVKDFIQLMMMSSIPEIHSRKNTHNTADKVRSKRSLHGFAGKAA